MTYKYGYDSSVETSEDEVGESEKENESKEKSWTVNFAISRERL